MQFTLATVALAAASIVSAQGVSSVITPTTPAPAGCSTDYAGSFEITVVLPSKKREIVERQSTSCAGTGILVASLKGGVLTDAKGRIGAIVANRQFQFDGPPAQTGSIYTGGWSVCNNGSLAIGGQTIFYQCLSGTFYNLYDQSTGAQCQQVVIDVIPCSGAGTGAGQASDGQPTGPAATQAATQISDGQIQASSAVPAPKPVSQFTDGQLQATAAASAAPPKGTPVAQITDGQVQASAAAPQGTPVAQITDGQVQASAAAPKGTPVAQITDGQVQASAAAPQGTPVAQITDGQVQASAAAPKGTPVAQITDGQVQAPAATLATSVTPVAQITDGQIQASAASNATKPTSSPIFAGAASSLTVGAQIFAGVIAMAAVAML